MANVTVLGSGSWGTALAVLLCGNGHDVILWSYLQEEVDEMKRTHRNLKLNDNLLPDKLHLTADMEEATTNRDLIVFAVPSFATRQTAHNVSSLIPEGQQVITVSKGIEEETLLTQCDIIEQEIPQAQVGILSGPSHAEEVIVSLPTAVVAGAKTRQLAVFTQEIFMNDYFRVYTSPDVVGIEVGGSLKNVIALASGMAGGLGYGDNARAALITRGLREITAIATAMGGKAETLGGLAGVGDLIVTCSSLHSRNYMAGFHIGEGDTPKEAQDKVGMVVEGVYSAKAGLALGKKFGIELPIIEKVNQVLFEDKPARDGVMELMKRDKKSEIEGIAW
ncbi:MAG: NAD(P)-dependent glycerol-3-phosphate dehydrogenase [Lachnospiraceae bacterium]|nr:NAD(P)-dependent glycerol-3-phosphate dehydrogenase [Lachnospiraceae bacterium]